MVGIIQVMQFSMITSTIIYMQLYKYETIKQVIKKHTGFVRVRISCFELSLLIVVGFRLNIQKSVFKMAV